MELTPFDGEVIPDEPTKLTPFKGEVIPDGPPKQNKSLAGDVGTALKKGVLGVPSVASGLLDIPAGLAGLNRPVDKATDTIGAALWFQPSKWAKEQDANFSPATQEARAAIDQAWADPNTGALDVAAAYLKNPRQPFLTAVESVPAMVAGGLFGRAAGAASGIESAPVRAAVGEGATMAGQAMDQIDPSTDPTKAALAATGIGVAGGAIGYAGGRVAERLGIADPDIAVSGGVRQAATRAPMPIYQRIPAGMVQEGLLEELPQTVIETGAQNIAEGKPVGEGMARQTVEGTLAGGLMGGTAAAVPVSTPPATQTPQPAATLTSAANVGQQTGANQQAAAIQAAAAAQENNDGKPGDVPAVAPGATGGAGDQPATGMGAGVGNHGAARPAVDAGDVGLVPQSDPVQPAPGSIASAVAQGPSYETSPKAAPQVPAAAIAPAGLPATGAAPVQAAGLNFSQPEGNTAHVPQPDQVAQKESQAPSAQGTPSPLQSLEQAATIASPTQAEQAKAQGQPSPEAPAGSLERGQVGANLAAGQVVSTASGRPTSPFPKINTSSNRSATLTMKAVDKWLMDNAIAEAQARGDTFAQRQFEANRDKPQQADKDSAEEYLFGGNVAPIAQPAQPVTGQGAGASQPTQAAPIAPPELSRAAAIDDGPAVVLQNRDRSSAASIAQMNEIAGNPDYLRAGQSSVMDTGAPVVIDTPPPSAVIGRTQTIADGTGKRNDVRYAVVEASDLLASHTADGLAVPEYANGLPGKLRAVAGNGRVAGLVAGYARGTTEQYKQDLIADAPSLNLDAQAVAAMKAPVLVRLMNAKDVTPDIADRGNIANVARLSAVEQANTDVRRLDLTDLELMDNGEPTPAAVMKFIRAMPTSEQSGLMETSGVPARQASERLMAAFFKQAYGSDDLVALYAQAQDSEAKTIMSSLAEVAGLMSKLKGTGEYDIRGAITEAAGFAVNARRAGQKLTDMLKTRDMSMSDEALVVATFMAENIRSGKKIAEGLRNVGAYALEQSQIEASNQSQGGMFGDAPAASRYDVLRKLNGNQDIIPQENDIQQPAGPEHVERAVERDAPLPAQRQAEPAQQPTKQPVPESAPQEVAKPEAPKPQGVSANKIFTEDMAAQARALLKSRIGTLNAGIDPEVLQAGITLAGYHIEKGARTFVAYAKAMINDLGEGIKPYLKSWYLAAKFDPRFADFKDMDSAATVEAASLDDKAAPEPDLQKRTEGGDEAKLDAQATPSPMEAAGFKPIPGTTNEWAQKIEVNPNLVHSFNIREFGGTNGSPVQYRLTQSTRFPGTTITGAPSVDLGIFSSEAQMLGTFKAVRNDILEKAKQEQKAEPAKPEAPKADGVTRAVAGGQQGINGEFYPGGAFLPSTDAPKGTFGGGDGTGVPTVPVVDHSVDVTPGGVLAGAGLVIEEKVSSKSGKTYWAVSGNTLDHKAALDAAGFGDPFKMGGKWYRSVRDGDPTERLAAILQGGEVAPVEQAERPSLDADEAQKVLRQFKVAVEQRGDVWAITGKSFDIKDTIKQAGGKWNGYEKSWTFTQDPTGFLAYALKERGSAGVASDDAGAGQSDAEIERRRELRQREDARVDERADAGDLAQHVSPETRALIERGAKFGIPTVVLNEQVEDIGLIVNAHQKNKPLFLLANEAGTGKTMVLGGAIRELRARGEKKFVYVTMNTDLIAQIQKDLADYGVQDVEFHTYSELSGKGFDASNAILIFDEAHNIKNVGAETARADKAQTLIGSAKMTLMASATLFENPVEARYLASTGIFDEVGGFSEWAKMYGAAVRVRKFYNPNTGREQTEEIIYWAGRGKKEDGAAARAWLFKQAIMTQRAMKIDPKMVDVQFKRNAVEQQWVDLYQQVMDAYDAAMDAWTDESGNPRDAMITASISMHRENAVKRILEASKIPFAIAEARDLLAAGRNVVVFVETKSDRTLGMWRQSEHFKNDTLYSFEQMQDMMLEWQQEAAMARMQHEKPPPRPFAEFIYELARYFDAAGINRELPSTADQIVEALGAKNVAIYTGAISNAAARQNKADFLAGKKTVLVATMAKGGTGLSLHDVVGNRPTTQLNINLPWKATGVDQVAARVARYGLQSKAEVRWLFASNIPWESQKLAPRVGARMRDMGAIVKGIEVKAAEVLDGNFDFEGDLDVKGGTLIGQAAEVDIYERAARMERLRRKADDTTGGFFETPFPLAALMARVSGIQPGMNLLEPSGGRGNLIRLLPEGIHITAVEQRADNHAVLQRLVKEGRVEQGDFMAWTGGQFSTVLMNPPFERVAGVGAQDVAHVMRAYDMLADGGRLVAIMGEGAFFRDFAQEKQFRDWLDDKGATVIQMPEGAFKQSGTGVRTRMVVIDKDGAPGRTDLNLTDMDTASLKSIEALVPGRSALIAARAQQSDEVIPAEPRSQDEQDVLTAPTRADVLAQQAALEAEAKRKEQGGDKPIERKVTGDTPDMFNTQGSIFDAPAEPEAPAAPAQADPSSPLQNKMRSYWLETARPALDDFFSAFRSTTAARLEKANIKTAGMSATDWLMSFVKMESTWNKGKKTGLTGIQYLDRKDLWPSDDGKGEDLRKAMLKAVRSLKSAPGYSSEWVKMAEEGSSDIFAEGQPAKSDGLPDAILPMAEQLAALGDEPKGDFDAYIAWQKQREQLRIRAIGDVQDIAIVKAEDGERWQMILPDVDGNGVWRIQSFDKSGFSGHELYASKELAIQAAASSRYTQRDDTALDRLQDTPEFQRGLYAAELISRMNRGEIDMAEMNRLMLAYRTDAADVIQKAETLPAAPNPAKVIEAELESDSDIADFGEKIGGARKDTARPTGPRMAQQKDDRPSWARKYVALPMKGTKVSIAAMIEGKKQEAQPGDRWQLAKGDGSSGMVTILQGVGPFASEQEALDMIPLVEVAIRHRTYPYSDNGKMLWGIFRRIGERKRAMIKGGFDTERDAMLALASDPTAIIEYKFPYPIRPWLDNVDRTGPARRKGNITVKEFGETFGFRGGEFGKWQMGGDGQEVLNHAYDGLMDLAEALGIPPKAISLNGELAIAFGSRGTGARGFKESGAAHYELDYEVINLTKMQGAGSLAHEWFHALDHYLSRLDGKASSEFTTNTFGDKVRARANNTADDMLTEGRLRKSNARPELLEAFKAVVDAMQGTPKEVPVTSDGVTKRLKRYRDSLEYRLRDLRDTIEKNQFDHRKNKKVATPEQLAQWDALAARLRQGDVGEKEFIAPPKGSLGMGRNSTTVLVQMNAIYKAVTGRSFNKTGFDSTGADIQLSAEGIKMMTAQEQDAKAKEEAGATTTVTRTSEYFINARDIDNAHAKPYWSTAFEMGARAFEAFIMDQIAERAGRSDYLVYGAENKFYEAFGMKPYPEGVERARINAAFKNLFAVIEAKPTDKGFALQEPGAAYNVGYETDLFGDVLPQAAGKAAATRPTGAGVRRNLQPAAAIHDTPVPSGEYFVNTIVGAEVQRELGASVIETPAQAAQATSYLYKSAVERFDAIVTDRQHRPIAVVGSFKGAITQTSVFPGTVIAEAVRVPGAAYIWFSHNHPSGTASLSRADENINRILSEAFSGSGIEPMGVLAVAGKEFAHISPSGIATTKDRTPPPGARISVPVIERQLGDELQVKGAPITTPEEAKIYAKAYYLRTGKPGILFLDAQNAVVAWMPITPDMMGPLRGTGALAAIYRGISQSNASSAILSHGGELDYAGGFGPYNVSYSENIAAALKMSDVRTLDSVNITTNRSVAESGMRTDNGPVFNRGLPMFTKASSAAQGQAVQTVQATADAIKAGWSNAPKVVVAFDMSDPTIPERIRLEDQKQRSGGATGTPEGFYYDGTVYLMASQLKTPQDAARVLFHESLGHFGLRGAFGGALKPILQQIATMRKAQVQAKLDQYGLDGNNLQDRLTAAEEVLAEMAQNTPEIGFVKRAIAAIRNWLRANVPGFANLKLTDADIIQAYILPARGWVERGQAAKASGVPAFKRGAGITDTLAFKKWFGDSKVVDAEGKPLVVYHGTRSDFNIFDPEAEPSAFEDDRGLFFFTNSAKEASAYAAGDAQLAAQDGAPNIMPVFLSLKNPKVVTVEGKRTDPTAYYDEHGHYLIPDAKQANHDGLVIENLDTGEKLFVAFKNTQIKSATGNNGNFDPINPDIRYSLKDRLNERKTVLAGQTTRVYTPEQEAAMRHTGFIVEKPSINERAQKLRATAWASLKQGIFDQFDPVKDISGEAYALLRLAKGASGAFETFLHGGKLKLTDGVYDFDDAQRGGVIDKLLIPMQGEHHDFMRWVAANRAERLLSEDREHLFTQDDIDAFKTLADGQLEFDYTIKNGPRAGQVTRVRADMFKDSLTTFNEFHKNILDLVEASGLIDGESRPFWEHEFYVPFYRVADEDGGVRGMNIKSGVVRQQAFKALKGGSQKLNLDLLDNTLMNWAHLLDASAKNRAAKATIEAAEAQGLAAGGDQDTLGQMAKAMGNKGGVVWFMDEGKKRYSLIDNADDGRLIQAISALEFSGMRSPIMNAMSAFKHALTLGVTVSPFFKVRNLIRDSLQVIGTSQIGVNPLANIKDGWKLTNPENDVYFRLLAGGGTIHFGTMYEGSEGRRVQALVESGVDAGTILNDEQKLQKFYRKTLEPMLTAYNELGNRGEAVNRAALYDQLVKQGMSHAQASLMARDLMDFSMQGSFTSVRFLTQVVPFLNARLQGLYKLGRAAKEDPKRMVATLGAVSLFSLALLAAYGDDDDWKKREEWDRNNYWWFKLGDVAYRIPKPFEIGAIATLAERSAELMFDDEMTGKRFREQVLKLAGDNLSMNPVPQLVKPLIDLYANRDSFRGTPIETMSQERLAPEYRYNDRTTMLARGASTALNEVAGVVGAQSLSPVQIDHLIRGYFSWLGTFVTTGADIVLRPVTGQPERAEPDYLKAATGGMVSDLRDAPSRYVSQMYEQSKVLEEAFGTYRMLQKTGRLDEAAAFREDNALNLGKYHGVEFVKRAESKLNERIRLIERSDMDPAEKRLQIRAIQARKDALARRVAN